MPRKRVEIAIEILHVDFHVRRRLRAVHQHRHAARARKRHDLLDRIDGAERVRHVRHADEPCALVEQLFVFVDQQFAGIVDRHDADPCSLLVGQHLPRHDVRMVLERGQDDFVAGVDELAPVTVHRQVDRFGGAAGEDHLALLARVDEARERAPRLFVFGGGDLRQGMHCAVYVRVLGRLVAHQAVDHLLRHLAGGRIVQIDQRLAARPEFEDRKIGADALDV